MWPEHVNHLVCPSNKRPLLLENAVYASDGSVSQGMLVEPVSGSKYPIIGGIPRFCQGSNYTDNFGWEWNVHARTQYDESTGVALSRKRFQEATMWEHDLSRQTMLEVGSGSGRFTTHALDTNALVMSFDYSNAVEANFASNGHRKNLCLVQASVYEMPFRSEFFDYAFCLGVLQHTPDPKTALFKIVDSLKPGGKIAADIYVKDIKHWLLATKYYVRPFVRHLPPTRLYDLTKRYVDLMWPIAKRIRKIPKIGTAINWRLLITDAWLLLPDADDETLRQWAYLDIFDMLSPTYDIPVTPLTFKRWMEDAGVSNIEITVPAHIIARGTKV